MDYFSYFINLGQSPLSTFGLSWIDLCKLLTMSFIFFMCFFLNPEYKLLFLPGSLNYIQIISNLNIFNPLFDFIFIVVLFVLLSFSVFMSQTLFTFVYSFCLLSLTFILFLVREASEHVFFSNQFFLCSFHLLYCFSVKMNHSFYNNCSFGASSFNFLSLF